MSTTPIAVDRTEFERSFREWQSEQAELETELADSFAALNAYQSNLDNWQQELVGERQELQELRAALEQERANGDFTQQCTQLENELTDAREKVSSLTSALLARTEELRELDQQRNEALTELVSLRTREQDLTATLASHQQTFEAERTAREQEIIRLREMAEKAAEVAASGPPARNSEPRPDARPTGNAVLGSVMEQFGKLREQRSMSRQNPKPR